MSFVELRAGLDMAFDDPTLAEAGSLYAVGYSDLRLSEYQRLAGSDRHFIAVPLAADVNFWTSFPTRGPKAPNGGVSGVRVSPSGFSL